ncbi:MAG: MFS transporter [Chloroherpetonaceae bacterium]|nr:MFS transporter [Chloroherpetonaceae bacterium]
MPHPESQEFQKIIQEERDAYAALKLPEYRLYLAARFLFTVAIQMQAVAVGWQVYEITKDSLSLGLVGLAEAIPSIAVALYAGHLADIHRRKQIILISLFVLLGCSLFLYFFLFLTPNFFQSSGAFPIYTVIFISGIARGFLTPAVFGLFAEIVPRSLYANAAAWSSTVWQTAAISGPAAGGLVVGFLGLKSVYFLDSLLMILSISMVFLIEPKIRTERNQSESVFQSIREGILFVFQNPIIISAISLDLFAVLFGGAVALLPIFATDILNVGAEGLGILRASPAIGAVVMAFWMAHHPPKENAGKILLLAVAGFGLSMIGFALSSIFLLSCFLLLLSGAFDEISVVIRSTVLQLSTPDHMRGRVSAVNNIFIGSSNEIGAFESGVAARLMGVIPSVIFGGGMTLFVVLVTAWKSKSIRELSLLNFRERKNSG